MKLKSVVTFLYLIISIPLFLFFKAEILVWLSFFINYLSITVIVYYHLNKEKNYSPFLSSYVVFTFLFFFVAPIIQISTLEANDLKFPNALPYSPSAVIFTNFLIFLFNAVFFSSYIFFKKKYLKSRKLEVQKNSLMPLLILTLFVLSAIIIYANYNYIIDEINLSSYEKNKESVFSLLIKKKVLFLVPLGAIALTYKYLKSKNRININTLTSFVIIIILLFFLFLLKNPLIEKRNALGPIYITLIYLFYPKIINSNVKTFLFLFLAMIIVFPLVSAITHVDNSLEEIIVNPQLLVNQFFHVGGISDAFNSLNYDAFPNIMATVEYASEKGLAYGYQLLSALLFFIPRGIWASKPTSSGEVIGDYLVNHHSFGDGQFTNLSNPMVSEGYINFGIFGTVLMAIALAFFVVKFIKWLHSADPLKEIIAFYFAIHLIFFLRGDFTNGFVYFIGTFIGVLIIPKIIHYILRAIFNRT